MRPDTFHRENPRLTAREGTILHLVVKSFIETAGPVASRFLSVRYDLGLSPASIRSTMNNLESKGYLRHPHTSAGRIPTNQGYRAFVDSLMESAVLTRSERRLMRSQLMAFHDDSDALIRESSRVLASLAGLLGVVLSPELTSGILERLEIVPVSSDRILFILSVQGGVIKTIVLNVVAGLERRHLDRLVELLNERLGGLPLDEIRRTCADRMMDLRGEQSGIVQLILNDSNSLFSEDPESRKVQVEGTTHILAQPEFHEADRMRGLVSLIGDSTQIRKLLEKRELDTPHTLERATVSIGREVSTESEDDDNVRILSIVSAQYQRSNMKGTIGVIGPTRMDYARMIALVEGMAMLMSWPASISGRSNRA